jgi:7-carboxy-7-deazaguanine synthase
LKVTADIENLPDQTLVNSGRKLPIMELFYTIQGEGLMSGMAAVFVRLGGCDVGCHWCDVKESWKATDHALMTIEEIVDQCESYNCENIVVTGGEPLMYEMGPLTSLMKEKGLKTYIETSGAYPLTGDWHWICLSPKKTKPAVSSVTTVANELKVVVFNNSDFDWAESYAEKVDKNCELYLQVEWSKREVLTPRLIDYVKRNPQWKLSLQTHKYIDIP